MPGHWISPRSRLVRPLLLSGLFAGLIVAACSGTATPPTSFVPGNPSSPRELNIIASDYAFVPPVVKVVPGETLLIHVVNGGLEPHEAVIGDAPVQAAWEAAHAAVAGHPPGPTPLVSVPPDVAGVRVFVASGQRVDVRWTVPVIGPAATGSSGWVVGCHIPGHFEKGMVVPIEFVPAAGGGSMTPAFVGT